MSGNPKQFHHHSLQDADSITELLNALTTGLSNGKLQLSDEESGIQLRPRGLLEVQLDATEEAGVNALTLKLRWSDSGRKVNRKSLRIR